MQWPGKAPGRGKVTAMMFWYGGGWPWWGAALMWIGMVAFWGLVIWGIWALVTSATRRPGPQQRDEEHPGGARRILDERLARGEIDDAEYGRLRDLMAADGDGRRAAAGTGNGAGTGSLR